MGHRSGCVLLILICSVWVEVPVRLLGMMCTQRSY